MFLARPLSCLVHKCAGELFHVVFISAQEDVITAHAWQLRRLLAPDCPKLHLVPMRNTRLSFYLLVKTLCSLSGIALLKRQSTPVVAGVRLSTLPLMLCYQTIHRRVFQTQIHNFVTLNVPVSFLAATFVSVHAMVLLHASVAIYQEILVV